MIRILSLFFYKNAQFGSHIIIYETIFVRFAFCSNNSSGKLQCSIALLSIAIRALYLWFVFKSSHITNKTSEFNSSLNSQELHKVYNIKHVTDQLEKIVRVAGIFDG